MFDKNKALAKFYAMVARYDAVTEARKKVDSLFAPIVDEVMNRRAESLKQIRISSSLALSICDAQKNYLDSAKSAGMDLGLNGDNPMKDGIRFVGTLFDLPIYEVLDQKEPVVLDA